MLNDSEITLQLRKYELDIVISNLDALEVERAAIEKSSIILMIYNMIEEVFSVLLQEIFDYLSSKSINIEKKSPHLLIPIVDYHLKIIKNDSKKLIEFRKSRTIVVPSFLEYKKYISFFSGNLDARKIRLISEKFGVTYDGKPTDEKLVFIKTIRNKLAHGELKYSEACRDKTSSEIREYIDIAYEYMTIVINAFKDIYV